MLTTRVASVTGILGTLMLLTTGACSSSSSPSSSGSATASGTVSGASFSAQDATFEMSTLPNSGTPPVSEIAILVTNYSGACGVANPSGPDAAISLVVLATAARTYSIDGQEADVNYSAQYDSTCHMHTWTTTGGGGSTTDHASVLQHGAHGTVTLTSVASTQVVGSFDVTFDSGDHVTGTFSAGSCTPTGGGSSC